MAGEWRDTTLGQSAQWLSGGTPFKGNPAFWSGPIPWVSAKDMKTFRLHDAEDHISHLALGNGGKVVPAGTILLLVRGMTLHNDVPICMVMREMAFNQDIKALRPAKDVDGGFLAYWLLANKPALLASVDHAGHGTGRLVTDTLKDMPIQLPPLAEQKRIAGVLGVLDDKIELNRRMNATLEAMARALFQSWFIDFDPVRANMDRNQPSPGLRPPSPKGRRNGNATDLFPLPLGEGRGEGCFALDPATAALFPDSFQESELGHIPKGWKVRPLAELIEVVKGRSYRSEELAESRTALVTLKSFLRGGGYRTDGLKPFTGEYKQNQRVHPGDLVVAFTDVTQAADVIGKPALVLNDDRFETLVASLDVGIVRPKSKQVSISFLYCLFLTAEFQAHAYSHATGTTVLHLGSTAIPSFVSVIPPVQIAETFAERTAPIFRLIAENAKQSATLATLRDTLLPKLLSGELSVSELENEVSL